MGGQLHGARLPQRGGRAHGRGADARRRAGRERRAGHRQTLPFLLLSIPFGLWADRSSRRRLMAGCELLRAASLLGLLVAVLAGQLSLPLLALLGLIGAVGTVGCSVAAMALLLRLHEPARTPAAPPHPLLELRDGAQLVWQHALLRPILLTDVAWNIAWFVLQAAVIATSQVRALRRLPAPAG